MNQPNDAEIAAICYSIYSDQPPSYWTHLWPHDGGYVGLYRWHDKIDVVVWRGSTTLSDWAQDLAADPEQDGRLGMVHRGFMGGVESVANKVLQAIARPVIVTGHSLGAGHALIHAGLLQYAKEDLLGVTVFGSPRPGGGGLQRLLTPVPVHSYKNRSDPVTEVPYGLGYVHPKPLIPVDVAPSLGDSWGLLADHHMPLYLTAMEGLYPNDQK